MQQTRNREETTQADNRHVPARPATVQPRRMPYKSSAGGRPGSPRCGIGLPLARRLRNPVRERRPHRRM